MPNAVSHDHVRVLLHEQDLEWDPQLTEFMLHFRRKSKKPNGEVLEPILFRWISPQ